MLLELMTGRRSMDINQQHGEQNRVAWARFYLRERKGVNKLVDPRLEGNFSIKGLQKVAQLAKACLSRFPRTRPPMSEVVNSTLAELQNRLWFVFYISGLWCRVNEL